MAPNIEKLKAKGNVEKLIKLLKHKEWDVRESSAVALGELGDSRAVEPLIAALKDKDEDVRKSTTAGLTNKHNEFRVVAKEALKKIAKEKIKQTNQKLFDVIEKGNLNDVEMTIKNGAKLNARYFNGSPLIHQAFLWGQYEIIKYLIKAGCDLNQTDDLGNTALIQAIQFNKKDIIELIIKTGCDVNKSDDLGNTALMYAISENQADIIKLLIKNGAETTIRNNSGLSALDWADQYNNKNIIQLIENSKKRDDKPFLECPKCGKVPKETKGSTVSPSINVYSCSCGWRRLRCGNTSCDGYMEAEEIGYPNTVRYTCTKCGWSGTGVRFN